MCGVGVMAQGDYPCCTDACFKDFHSQFMDSLDDDEPLSPSGGQPA